MPARAGSAWVDKATFSRACCHHTLNLRPQLMDSKLRIIDCLTLQSFCSLNFLQD